MRSGGEVAGDPISITTAEQNDELAVTAVGRIQAPASERAATVQLDWPITNGSGVPVVVTRFTSETLTLFHVGALPVRIAPGETARLRLVVVPNHELPAGERSVGSASVTVESTDGTQQAVRSVVVETAIEEPSGVLSFTDLPVDGLPVRLATWDRYLYGSYDDPDHRLDLVGGLPRNVTNHVPSGMDIGRDGWLYVAVGAMTDSGLPDPSKPDPDTPLSGVVLRINLTAPGSAFPAVPTEPEPDFAGADDLVAGIVEIWATGVRNGFGLTFVQNGDLLLTDQSSDGGSAPRPLGETGPSGINTNVGVDHLHRVEAGGYLGQPNISRGELVLDDGSGYDPPVASPDYRPPLHVFGIHNSATGISEYRGELFPDLEGWLLVGKFSGGLGLEALRLEGDHVVDVRTLTAPPTTRNVTDVAVGPAGEIVIAEFWEQRIRISSRYE